MPDRFVKGKCPKCGAEEQYGDVCEKCNSAYATTDLIEPKCVICGKPPIRKKSVHYFFKLSALSDKLEKWLVANKKLQDEVRNFVLNWIKEGLKDWDISRDGPYFGFKIPGEENKYYYVWLDAPIGYIASTWNYASKNKLDAEKDYWKNPDSEIVHFIGKDIIYFHFLFWPALLMAADFNLPSNLVVHGFLKVNGEKMSKSRGTFLTAKDFLSRYGEQGATYLRYYYASNLSRKLSDIDLSFKDFHDRINNELVANIANLGNRSINLLNTNHDSLIGADLDDDFLVNVRKNYDGIKESYLDLDFREAVKRILFVSSLANKYMQDNAPWKLIDSEPEKAHSVVSTAANVVKDLCILIRPILPDYAEKLEKQLSLGGLAWDDLDANIIGHTINKAEIIIRKIDIAEIEKILSHKHGKGGDNMHEKTGMHESGKEGIASFGMLNVKVAEVISVEPHPNADKLYVARINLGSEERQIIAGLRAHYQPEQLVGKKLCVITNLERAKMRGIESQAMLLAGAQEQENGTELVGICYAEKSKPGDQVYVDGIEPDTSGKQVSFKEFQAIELKIAHGRPSYNGKPFKTDVELINVERVKDGAKVR